MKTSFSCLKNDGSIDVRGAGSNTERIGTGQASMNRFSINQVGGAPIGRTPV